MVALATLQFCLVVGMLLQTLAISATVESAAFGIGGKRFYLSARHGRRDDGTETLDIHLHLENSHSVQPEIQVNHILFKLHAVLVILATLMCSSHLKIAISQ